MHPACSPACLYRSPAGWLAGWLASLRTSLRANSRTSSYSDKAVVIRRGTRSILDEAILHCKPERTGRDALVRDQYRSIAKLKTGRCQTHTLDPRFAPLHLSGTSSLLCIAYVWPCSTAQAI